MTKLPTNIDEKICTLFSMSNQWGYQHGFEILCEHVDEETALFTTFCHWLLDEQTGNRIEINGDYLEIKEQTVSIAFGKDYKYEFFLEGQFMEHQFDLSIGEYSRYQVGLGTYQNDLVERFAIAVGRYEEYGFKGLIELNYLVKE